MGRPGRPLNPGADAMSGERTYGDQPNSRYASHPNRKPKDPLSAAMSGAG